ncbi:hypothetical protein V6N12_068647 [Hibiscus sabdariffa]|uniref:Uncharacterized protein n=1 Tax=Hibiscus sabdariffa TaxID=183260 RepID=A0ABR2FQY9_9ROSI
MVDEFDEEEEIRLPKKKKNEKKGSRATIDSDTTLGKRKKKSKWWENFSIDEENPAFASCMKDLTLKQPEIIIDETFNTLDDF